MLVQLIYVSVPKEGKRDEINAELPGFQKRNKEKGMGGMVLSHAKFILQLIEGERHLVNKAYRSIMSDDRHTQVTLIRYNDVRKAEFLDWNFAVIDNGNCECSENCAEFLHHMLPDLNNVSRDITSSSAMAIIRKAAMIALVYNAPNRRKTDVRELPAF